MIDVKLKKLHAKAVIPSYSREGDCAMDLTAVTVLQSMEGYYEYDTGIAVEIPEGYVGLVFPRSSVSNTNLTLANAVGVIDSNYRGSIKLRFKPLGGGRKLHTYKVGDRVGQLMIIPHPKVTFSEVTEFSTTTRGTEGFGSSGI